MAGNLQSCVREWELITSDKIILEYINGYKIPFKKTPYQENPVIKSKLSIQDQIDLGFEIDKLLKIGAIERCNYCEGQFVSPCFLVPKPDGSKRFIINLKRLNEYIQTFHFKLEDLRTAVKLLTPDAFMCSIDIKDAFFSIPMNENYKKFLRFSFKGSLYQFKCLPFGLCTSPMVFTKVMKPIISFLRSEGLISSIYLDDILCIGKDFDTCLHNAMKTVDLISKLGFSVNYKKSCLVLSQTCKYLGFILNSSDFTIELTEKKRKNLTDSLLDFSTKATCRIRAFAQFIGFLVSCVPAVSYGMLYCKNFEREKCLALILNEGNYDAIMSLPKYLQEDIDWWLKNLKIGKNPIKTLSFKKGIYSDASLTGWGAHCDGTSTHGFWDTIERKSHINYLELLAILFALKSFGSNLRSCELLIRCDNTTAISYVNRMGGIRIPKFNRLTREIWKWCEDRKIWLSASYVPSKQNVDADIASRIKNMDTEWELSNSAYKQIVNTFGDPDIDLFASRINKKCDRFCSWRQDPEAFAVDAFTLR